MSYSSSTRTVCIAVRLHYAVDIATHTTTHTSKLSIQRQLR